jgi:hypothetical protein
MPVKKFRSFEEAERDLWTFRPDARYYKRVRAFYGLAVRLHAPSLPRGVFKFRTMEEASSSAMPAGPGNRD